MENKRKVEFKFSYRIRTKETDELNAKCLLEKFNEIGAFRGKIDACYQYENNKTWIIGLNEPLLDQKGIDQFKYGVFSKIEINGKKYILEDASETYSYFRVGWLPHQVDEKKICFELFRGIKCQGYEIRRETYDIKEYKNVYNGNWLFIAVNGVEMEKVKVGVRELDGFKCFVNQLGVKPICLFCQNDGHIKKNCPKRSLKCDRCKGQGHSMSECNFARAANKKNEEALLNAPDDMEGVISTATLKEQFEKEKLEKGKKQQEIEQKKKEDEIKKNVNNEQKNNVVKANDTLKQNNSTSNVQTNNAKRKEREKEIETSSPITKTARGRESELIDSGGTMSGEDSLERVGDD